MIPRCARDRLPRAVLRSRGRALYQRGHAGAGTGDPQSLNRYSYVQNNPLKYTDPSGHYAFEENPRDRWIYSNAAVRSAHYYTHPEYEPGQVSAAETLLAATAPLWAPAVAAGGVTVGASGEAVSWKALEWVLGRPILARILGLGGSAAARELADGDDDEVRAVEAAAEPI